MGKRNLTTGDDEHNFDPHYEEQDTAIQVLGLHKRYRKFRGSKVVLNGLNLKCRTGKLFVTNCFTEAFVGID